MALINTVMIMTILIVLIETANFASLSTKDETRVKRDDKYTTEFDGFDVDEVLKSDRLIKSYIKCLRDLGPCTNEGRTLKEYLPDALKTDCAKCSEVQKKQSGRVLAAVLQNYRDEWNALIEKYDPEGIFRKKYAYDEETNDDEE